MSTTQKPVVFLDFDGEGGNVFVIMRACQRAARRAGWPKEAIDAWMKECTQSDYDHVLDIVFECFDVQRVVKGSVPVSRDDI